MSNLQNSVEGDWRTYCSLIVDVNARDFQQSASFVTVTESHGIVELLAVVQLQLCWINGNVSYRLELSQVDNLQQTEAQKFKLLTMSDIFTIEKGEIEY